MQDHKLNSQWQRVSALLSQSFQEQVWHFAHTSSSSKLVKWRYGSPKIKGIFFPFEKGSCYIALAGMQLTM